MKNIGVFVGERGNWSFFNEIFKGLSSAYHPTVFVPPNYRLPILSGRLNRWAFRQRMRSILQENRVNFFEWASDLLEIATHMPKTNSIVTRLHAFELFVWGPKINWGHVDRVILVSQSMQHEFIRRFPEHSDKSLVVYNGVDLEKFVPPAQRAFQMNIGMLCRINPVKRIYEMVMTIYRIKRLGFRPHLYIGGGWDSGGFFETYYVAILRLIEKLDLSNEVTICGEVKQPSEWLKNIDIYVSNSYFEGQQVSLIEAMASGCYCLAHAWEGAGEIVPQENLFLTDEELVQKIVEYAKMDDLKRNQRQARMREIASEKFDVKRQIAQIRNVVDETFLA